MAKKKQDETDNNPAKYRVVIGFDDSKERRFEAGDEIADGVLVPADIKELLIMEAIERV